MSDSNGDGSVRITQREVYNLVLEVRDGVHTLVERDEAADRIHTDHEDRLRVIEEWKAEVSPTVAQVPDLLTWRWKAAGALLLAVLLISTFGYFIAQSVVHR